MFYASMNKTKDEWTRKGIRNEKPSDNSDEILDRIHKLNIDGMSFDDVVDYYRMQLSSWRRFYKESDEVVVTHSVTSGNLRAARIKSLNIVFYIIEESSSKLKINASFVTDSDEDEEISEI